MNSGFEFWRRVLLFLKLEAMLEWRRRYTLYGIVVFMAGAVFITSLAAAAGGGIAWSTTFWLILLFIAVTTVAKSFIADSPGLYRYYYLLSDAQSFIIAKIIYNSVLLGLLSLLSLSVYSLFIPAQPIHVGLYALITLCGALSLAALLTITSAIASKSGNGGLLMPVLSFPLLIPLLLVAVKSGKRAFDGLDSGLIYTDLWVLAGFYLLIAAVGFMLYPFLRQE